MSEKWNLKQTLNTDGFFKVNSTYLDLFRILRFLSTVYISLDANSIRRSFMYVHLNPR